MADDVKRLVLQVDASVELARRNLVALSSLVDTETKRMEGGLARVDKAHRSVESTSNSARSSVMELQHVFRSFGDSVAAGQDPVRAFVMELGRVGQAAEAMGQNGALGSVGKFLGGPWGLVLSAGIALLASLAGGHDSASDAAKKQASTADLLRRALKGDAEAARDLAEAINAEYDAANKSIRTTQQAAQAAFNEAKAKRDAALATREKTKAELDAALAAEKEALARAKAPQVGAHDAEALRNEADYRFTQGRVAELQGLAAAADVEVQKAQRAFRASAVPIVEQRASEENDPSTAVRGRFEREQGRLRQQFAAGALTTDKLRVAEARLMDQRDAALKAIEEANRKPRDTSRRDAADATSVAYVENWLKRALPGVQVTSTTNHSKYVAGTNRVSDHYSGRAIDFVPPGGLGSMTQAQVRDMFESAGMRIRRNAGGVEQLFGPWMGTGTALGRAHQNHIHVGFEGSAPTGAALDKAAESAREKAARNQETYELLLLRAQEDLANATRTRATTAEEAEGIAVEDIEIERRRKQSAAQSMVAEGRITQAQADQLNEKYRQVASAKIRTAAEVTTQRVIEREAEHERTMLTGMVVLLHLQEGLATTAVERKRIALQILDYEERTARASLRAALAAEKDPDRRKDIETRLGQIDTEHPLKVEQINRANESPLERYKRELNAGLSDIHSRLEDIEVQGLKGLEDDAAGALSKVLKLHGALGDVLTMLIRIGLEKGLQALFGIAGGTGGLTAGQGNALDSVFGSIGGGGGIFSGLGFAGGGDPPVGKASLIGEKGPELFVPKSAGTILSNSSIRRALGGGAGRAAAPDTLNVVVTASEDFDVRVERTSARHVAAAAPGIAGAAAKQTIRTLTRPRL